MQMNPLALPTFGVAAVLFWAGAILARRTKSPVRRNLLLLMSILLAIPALACDLFYTHLFDRWMFFYEFRAAEYSELTIAGVGLIAGMLYRWMEPETLGERLVVPAVLIVVVGLPFSKSLLAPVDLGTLQTECVTEVCRQSTMSTCGPSSAATILKQYGYAASERELAQEAFSYKGGTEAWYLARALRRRGFDAEFVIQDSVVNPPSVPSIAGVVLPGDTGHFVAVLDADSKRLVTGDPLTGKLEGDRAELNKRYRFTGFFLVVNKRAS